MNFKKTTFAVMILAALALGAGSCKSQASKDAAAKAKIEVLVPGISVEVKDGIAMVNGVMPSEHAKTAAETAIKSVEGIKSLVINATVAETAATVVVNADQALMDASASLLKEFPGVTAAVKDGVITLNGEIKETDWMKLKPLLDALHPKKVATTALKIN